MKKTLAILLALLAAASITLASCTNDDRQPADDDWDKEDNDYVETDDTDDSSDTSGETNNDNTNDDGNNNDNSNANNSGWETKNDTVYAGVKIFLREQPSTSGTDLGTIPWGSALSRESTNGTWDKVTYNGKTGYVNHTYVSTKGSDFSFTNCDTPVDITLSISTSNNVVFYQTPFSPDNFNTFDLDAQNALLASGIKAANLAEGYSLKKVAVSESGSWVKVELTGKVTVGSSSKDCAADTFYIRALAFNRGDIVDSTWNSGSTSGGESAFG